MPAPRTESSDRQLAMARQIRRDIVTATTEAGSGHPSTSLSMVEVLTALFFGGVLRYDPEEPRHPDRDRFILSKGHGAPGLYSALAAAGYFSPEELTTLRKLGSPLEGHPNMCRLPGVEASTGSLGQGLSIGVGHALAGRLDKKDYRVYVMVGDGESQQGQVWEAIMHAGNQQLDNLTLILDRNGFQQTDAVDNVQPLDPLAEKLTASKWQVQGDRWSLAGRRSRGLRLGPRRLRVRPRRSWRGLLRARAFRFSKRHRRNGTGSRFPKKRQRRLSKR